MSLLSVLLLQILTISALFKVCTSALYWWDLICLQTFADLKLLFSLLSFIFSVSHQNILCASLRSCKPWWIHFLPATFFGNILSHSSFTSMFASLRFSSSLPWSTHRYASLHITGTNCRSMEWRGTGCECTCTSLCVRSKIKQWFIFTP